VEQRHACSERVPSIYTDVVKLLAFSWLRLAIANRAVIENATAPRAGAVEMALKQIGSRRLLFGGMLAHAPFFVARSLIQSAS
jgi:hypothetical protein